MLITAEVQRQQPPPTRGSFFDPEHPIQHDSNPSHGMVLYNTPSTERSVPMNNRMFIMGGNSTEGIVAVDVFSLFGALILWMAIITALVVIIVWLLCNNGSIGSRKAPPGSPQKLDESFVNMHSRLQVSFTGDCCNLLGLGWKN
jgi:hypothetical protein